MLVRIGLVGLAFPGYFLPAPGSSFRSFAVQFSKTSTRHGRQFSLSPPGIQAVVDQEAWHPGYRAACQFSQQVKASRSSHRPASQFHGPPFLPRQIAAAEHILTEHVQLMMQIDLDRADIRTRTAQAAGEGQTVILADVTHWTQDRTDRPGNGGCVTVPAASSIDGAGIQASSAANAAERIPVLYDCRATHCGRYRQARCAVLPRAPGRGNARYRS